MVTYYTVYVAKTEVLTRACNNIVPRLWPWWCSTKQRAHISTVQSEILRTTFCIRVFLRSIAVERASKQSASLCIAIRTAWFVLTVYFTKLKARCLLFPPVRRSLSPVWAAPMWRIALKNENIRKLEEGEEVGRYCATYKIAQWYPISGIFYFLSVKIGH